MPAQHHRDGVCSYKTPGATYPTAKHECLQRKDLPALPTFPQDGEEVQLSLSIPPWVTFAVLGPSHHSSCCGQIPTSPSAFPPIPLLPHPLCLLLPQAQKNSIHVKGQAGIQSRGDSGLLDLSPLQNLSTSHLKVMVGIVQQSKI